MSEFHGPHLRRLVAVMLVLLLAGVWNLVPTSARADSLSTNGFTVTWKTPMYVPVGNCSVFDFNYTNDVGFEILSARLYMRDQYGADIHTEWETGVPNGAQGTWHSQICPFELTSGVGPYTLTLFLKDYNYNTVEVAKSFRFAPRPKAPGAPGKPQATSLVGGKVRLLWRSSVANGASVTYAVQSSATGRAPWATLATTKLTTSTVQLRSVKAGSWRHFRIVPRNMAGLGPPSATTAVLTR